MGRGSPLPVRDLETWSLHPGRIQSEHRARSTAAREKGPRSRRRSTRERAEASWVELQVNVAEVSACPKQTTSCAAASTNDYRFALWGWPFGLPPLVTGMPPRS